MAAGGRARKHGGTSMEVIAMWNGWMSFLARCRGAGGAAPAAPAAALPPDDRALGCGWFDSSHDLASGVRVTELDDAATPLWRWAALGEA
jgi:hypothetical protein